MKIIKEETVRIGDKLKSIDKKSVLRGRTGKVIRISGNDMAIVDFGNGDIYGIVFSRIKNGEIIN